MLREMLVISALNVFLAFATGFALASGEEDAPQPDQAQKQQQDYASPLMTEQELIEQRAKMHAAKTADEQEQILEEHHARMKEQSQGAW